jgi:16S rRNA (guanine527-N7)-methyltransferase
MEFELSKINALNQIKKFCPLDNLRIKNLENFVLLVLAENQKFNFIGKSTVQNIWQRHILDSAQLLDLIENKNLKFADLGSGAGFPGLILSILGLNEIHLIEKSFRKAEFLRRAKLLSPNHVFIHQVRLEELSNLKFDCITSRALAPMNVLLGYVQKFLNKNGYCLFLKGKNSESEITLAKEKFCFEYEVYPSLTSEESSIIKVLNVCSL